MPSTGAGAPIEPYATATALQCLIQDMQATSHNGHELSLDHAAVTGHSNASDPKRIFACRRSAWV
jgi:hypothetical protein